MVHPILLIRRHIIPWELSDNEVHPIGLSIRLELDRGAHLELRPHVFP